MTPLSSFYGQGFSFNDVPDQLNLHQQWLYIEKTLDADSGDWDWGGRVDIMYGTDASKTQAFGTTGGWDNDWDYGVYGWAIPQAYLEVGTRRPFDQGWTFLHAGRLRSRDRTRQFLLQPLADHVQQ